MATSRPVLSFAGSAEEIMQSMGSLFEIPNGDNAVFGDSALRMMEAVLPALVDLRDQGIEPLSVASLRHYLSADKLIDLARHSALAENSRTLLLDYLISNGYRAGKEEQGSMFYTWLSYSTSYWMRPLENVIRAESDIGDDEAEEG